jgi:hypothetical protein
MPGWEVQEVSHIVQIMIAASAAVVLCSSAGATVRVAYEGQSVATSAPVLRSASGTLVPLRAVTQALGGRLEWDALTRRAVARRGDRTLEVDPQTRTLRVNGRRLPGSIAPRTSQGHLLVPLAAVEQAFGVDGRWSPGEQLLHFAAAPGAGQPEGQNDGAQEGPVRLRLTTSRPSYAAGAPVLLTLTVTNPTRSPVTLQFSSGQKYDLEVRRAGQVVWQWAADRMFTQALTSLTLAPGERKVFTENWKQQDNSGQPAPAGSYQAVATLTTMEKPQPRSTAVAFRIGR